MRKQSWEPILQSSPGNEPRGPGLDPGRNHVQSADSSIF